MCNHMRQITTTIFILMLGMVYGQEFIYPSIVTQGKNINSFVPNGWKLLDSAKGDLNKDTHDDIALIIQHKDSISLVVKEFGENETVITQPRVLIILFYNPTKNNYFLKEKSNSFILNHDNPNMDDPYENISINKGVLKIDFHIFMNMGGWGMSSNIYKFRYQKNEFVLIGADCFSTNRGSGATEDTSYNFLTNKVKVSTGSIESDEEKVLWRTLKIKKLKTFKTFTKPFTWEIEKDIFL